MACARRVHCVTRLGLNLDRLSSKEEYNYMLQKLNATTPAIQIGPNYTVNPENNCKLQDSGQKAHHKICPFLSKAYHT